MSQYLLEAVDAAREKVRSVLRRQNEAAVGAYLERLTEKKKQYERFTGRKDPLVEAEGLRDIAVSFHRQMDEHIQEFNTEMKELEVWEDAMKAGKRIGEAAAS